LKAPALIVSPPAILSPRKASIRDWADRFAEERDRWIEANSFYYEDDLRFMRFLIPEDLRVLELGCATGHLLAALKPSYGVGVDLSERMIAVARRNHPGLHFFVGDIEAPGTLEALGGPFDVIVLSDTIGLLEDCESTLRHLHALCTRETRIVIAYYNRLWGPLLRVGELLRAKMPQQPGHNWLSTDDILGLLNLADHEPIKRDWRQLIPRSLLGVGRVVNRFIGTLPVIRRACLRNYIVARPSRNLAHGPLSASVVVPCRNERGNIEAIVRRVPRVCADLEILFVEGHSKDGTLEEIRRVIGTCPELDIKVFTQVGEGKGDAVRHGFKHARGDVLMILDADMTMPPEALSKFYRAVVAGKGEFINGSRLVYPMPKQAMRPLNFLANRGFAVLFSWLLNQRFTDTLCGTKALTRTSYARIAANREYFGDFDPFGDFDLIFGAAKLNLKIIEIPIRYTERTYGETQISRFRHGWLLFQMAVVAYMKLKAL